MLKPEAPKFAPHGRSQCERRGQLLLLHSQGPFNAEHVQAVAPMLRAHGTQLATDGPWASINIVSASMLATPEAIEMMRRSAEWSRVELGRVASAFVAGADVEGREIMQIKLRDCYSGVMPVGFFASYADAEAWALEQIEAH